MNHVEIEKKWRKKWDETHLYKFDRNNIKDKKYVLEMFSYPSAAKLHIGHWYNFGLADSYARFLRMQGYNVYQPMGFDAFGLPAENYAIKTGIHPKDSTLKNISIMEEQLRNMGAMFDWDSEIKTCMPDYYKWTQWIFVQLFKHGLAYRKEAPVNWCPSCNTVLANEQVQEGRCERCGTEVIRKNLTQWFFKITDYAEELLQDLDKLDWPEKTKLMQKNWIGKSTGGEIEFDIVGHGKSFRAFTTRADTLFGVSYVVLAPEHPLVKEITTDAQREAVEQYIADVAKTNEIERLSTSKEKTGVFTGAYAVNPINGKQVPIWIADYVLYSYGTGAVMGVPSHDERDFDFANKYGLEITRVIKGKNGNDDLPFCEYGMLVNSGEFDGMTTEEAKIKIIEKLAEKGKGQLKTNYRLRDWLVSRQRYWGAPIPIVHCPHCGTVPVPEDQLPVELPYDVNFTPDGTSPLAKHEGFMHTKCPKCGADATRDPDTLDTFVCSSWYFLRYPDSKNDKEAFNREWIDKMLPVDKYIGGAEHACMHLLYARFFTKALRDMGYLDFDEPFLSLVHQGVILGTDGFKMSKTRGNVVSPDDYISVYGSDVFRMYLGFGFNYVEGGPWNDDGIKAIAKWIDRVERIVLKSNEYKGGGEIGHAERELDYVRNFTIKNVTDNYGTFSFNTAIARMMELVNAMSKYIDGGKVNGEFYRAVCLDLIKLMAPLAPHFAEELWELTGNEYSVFNQKFPVVNEKALVKDEVEIAVQVNAKIRSKIVVAHGADNKAVEEAALADEKIKACVEGKQIKKVIVIPNRLVNIIVG